MRRKIPAASVVVATLALYAAFGGARAAADNTKWGANYFPNVVLTTQDGAQVRFYDDLLKGKIVAINLIYTTCKYMCPLETARLAQVQRVLGDRMGRDIFFYSITIDPENDTPAVLKEYAKKYHAGPGWTFLTGKKEEIDLISKKIGLYADPTANADGHAPMLLVGNEATGQWMRNSAVDNPRFLATTLGDWLDSWQNQSKTPLKSYAEVPKLVMDKGQYTFKNHCAACHTIGSGSQIGPDLHGVTTRRDRDWLARFIINPDKVRASGDPIAAQLRAQYKQAVMPSLALGADDVAVLIDYIDKQSRAVGQPPAAAAPVSVSSRAVDMKPVVDPYIRIQQALNADSVRGVSANARAIATEAVKLGPNGAAIASAAAALERAVGLKAVRAAMGTLSDAVISQAKESSASMGDGVKVAFCPMLQKYWLQRGDTIQNPFYGTQMSDCGRISANLPALKKAASSGAGDSPQTR